MGLMANNPQMFQNGAAPQQAPAQQPQQNMQAQLAAEEQQLRQQAQQQQAQMPAQLSPAQLADLCQRIINYGFGFPALGGNLGQFYASVGGQNVMPGFVFNGVPAPAGAKRSLHSVQINELAHLLSLEGEMATERGVPNFTQQPTVMPGLAMQQPAQQPQQVQVPQQPGFQQQLAQTYNQTIAQQPVSQPWQGLQQTPTQQPTQALGFLPPDAPQSMPQLAMTQQTPVGATNEAPQGSTNTQPTGNAQSAPEQPKRTRGRPKGQQQQSQDATPGQTAATTPPGSSPPNQPAAQAAPQVAPAPSSASSHTFTEHIGPRVVLVNCRSEGIETSSLASYVDYINAETAKKYNWGKDGQQGILDVRAAKDGSVLGFGGWKGAVREIVKVDQPGDGMYHLNTNRDDLCEAVVDGLRQAGWLIVRGVFS